MEQGLGEVEGLAKTAVLTRCLAEAEERHSKASLLLAASQVASCLWVVEALVWCLAPVAQT